MKHLARIPVDRSEGIRVHSDYPGYHPFENFEGMVEGTQFSRDDHNNQGPKDGREPITPKAGKNSGSQKLASAPGSMTRVRRNIASLIFPVKLMP
jgi:hypothetical protein